jgi:UDP-2,3-diacylglucosamine hydrolase
MNVFHFISDLHLAPHEPKLTELFIHYMQNEALKSDSLYVLGDLFDVWIGDDCLSLESSLDLALPSSHCHLKSNTHQSYPFYQKIVSTFKQYTESKRSLFFIHGNRDFLLGALFEEQTGGRLLNEPYLFTQNNTTYALMHGDTLCTDDHDYQTFRKMIRSPLWQKQFLALSQKQRKAIAFELRQKSNQAQKNKSMPIMDVNASAVYHCLNDDKIDHIIHGHTHRPNIHQYMINGIEKKRYVLSDWSQEKGHYLSCSLSSSKHDITSHHVIMHKNPHINPNT